MKIFSKKLWFFTGILNRPEFCRVGIVATSAELAEREVKNDDKYKLPIETYRHIRKISKHNQHEKGNDAAWTKRN